MINTVPVINKSDVKKYLCIFNYTENSYFCSLFMEKNSLAGAVRKGDIAHIDFENGHGIIIDENGQDIHFQLGDVEDQITLHSKITFDIELHKRGLVAVHVKLEREEVKV